ncbi:adenosine deaminase family protein [Pigmentiphaga kullae]|uniref:Adenosine deaminase n=1 Tax=Pigmentiphaga kullae TaxID=151784 RepID=A0A4Q7NDR5_9BURK|nr:adenosine deaminase [Pigmentiphaga kullae]RZS81100.1 adenosine deaminase [Pigmentiphaga kullae]
MPDTRISTEAVRAFCHALPKAELHCHLLGALRRSTFHELAGGKGGLSSEQIDGLYAHGEKRQGAIPGLRALEDYGLRTLDDFYRVTREYLEDARAHNVLYAEFFWNPTGSVRGSGLSYAAIQDAMVRAIHDAERDLGIVGRLVPAIDREAPPAAAVEMVEWMVAARRDEVPGIGIDYREALGPPEWFEQAYADARRAGLKTTAHAGEYGLPWTNVRTALDVLKVDRIDHGYTVVDQPELARRCVESGIVFAVVPANSYYLRTLPPDRWALEHPIRKMRAMGLRIHPNSDDPTLHNITQTKAWTMMVEDFEFPVADLRGFMLNGLAGAWVDAGRRRAWSADWNRRFDELHLQHFGIPATSSHSAS